MKRVLQIIHGLSLGGSETFVYNLLKGLDEDKYRVDFLIQNPKIRHERLKSLILDKGGHLTLITDFRKNLLKHIKDLKAILSEREYDIVHIHINSLVNPFPVIMACRFAKKVIVHSHNTKNGEGGLPAKLVHKINTSCFLNNRKINRLACGEEAGRWMFRNKKYTVIPNAVDLSIYYPSSELRKNIRSLLKIEDELVIGQIGRLEEVKNQIFSLKILAEYKKRHPKQNIKGVFIGEGSMKEELKEQVSQLGLEENVIFTGGIQNPETYMQAFDCLILPSLFEGFAFVAVEAQASGLPIIASDNNTKDINITGNVVFLSLNQSIDKWVMEIEKVKQGADRIQIANHMNYTNFDLGVMVQRVEEVYDM